MTPRQRGLIEKMILRLNKTEVRKDEFLVQFPATDGIDLSISLMREAVERRDPEEISLAMQVMFCFGVLPDHLEFLKELCESDWHDTHEDVVDALEYLHSEETIECFYRMIHWIPPYVEDWESENIPAKAIWALSKIPDIRSRTALERSRAVVVSPNLLKLIDERLLKSTVWRGL